MTADTFYRQIIRADNGYELNTLAEQITSAVLAPVERERLQLAFTHRCRELWPRQCTPGKGSRSTRQGGTTR